MIYLIQTPQEFRAVYFYKSPPNPEPTPSPEAYPSSYPCVLHQWSRDMGIGGDYVEHDIYYPPPGEDPNTFYSGFQAGMKAGYQDSQY